MKKHLLAFTLIIILTTQTKAQTSVYHPFPDSGIVWRQYDYAVAEQIGTICGSGCCTYGEGPCYMNEDYEYFIAGDTLIGSNICKKILITGNVTGYQEVNSCSEGCDPNTYYSYTNFYAGAMRQDTIERKVYFIANPGAFTFFITDTLLYDFNLNIGDTLPQAFNNNYPSNYVSYIDSILIAGNYHKRFWLSYNNNTNYVAIIEGIGSTFGLLAPFYGGFNSFWGGIYSLLCVTIDSIPVYPDTATVCELVTGAKEIKNIEESFSLYPNPATKQLNIQTSSFHANESVTISIMNVLGQIMREEQMKWSSDVSLNINNFPAGMYFLEMKTESGSVVKRFVKE